MLPNYMAAQGSIWYLSVIRRATPALIEAEIIFTPTRHCHERHIFYHYNYGPRFYLDASGWVLLRLAL